MNKTKVYVIEFDYWSFIEVYSSYEKANETIQSNLETIREYKVKGEIINNEVFAVLDDCDEWYGLFATEKEAEDRVKSHLNTDIEVYIKKVKLLK